jgi:lipopolysaccharide export system permease protein
MQFFWLYMDDLIGKGLPLPLIIEMMLYMAATLVPLSMPLGILLASIMTFGNLGESYELVAVKSSGISLFRFMRPLTLFISAIVVGMFLFSNYVIPKVNLKAQSLLYDMRNQKPTMSIKPGVFNKGIGNFAIRVGRKSEDGKTIGEILIYDHTNTIANNNVIAAETGKMYLSNDKKFLVFELNDGWRYEFKKDDSGSYEQQRMYFKHWTKVVDVSSFMFNRTNENLFSNNEEMMNVSELSFHTDSMYKVMERDFREYGRNVSHFISLKKSDSTFKTLTEKLALFKDSVPSEKLREGMIAQVPDSLKADVASKVASDFESLQRYSNMFKTNRQINEGKVRDFDMEWHKKFTFAFACLVLFLIGAPMGAIVRKGGLGMPAVISVSFFVIYFVLSSTGEKLAKQAKMTPFEGMWLATLSLTPIAILVLIQARNDSSIFKKESYLLLWNNLKSLLIKIIKPKPAQPKETV